MNVTASVLISRKKSSTLKILKAFLFFNAFLTLVLATSAALILLFAQTIRKNFKEFLKQVFLNKKAGKRFWDIDFKKWIKLLFRGE